MEITKTKDELKAELKSLGQEIKGNPGVEKLQKQLDAFYDAEAVGDMPKVKPDTKEDESETTVVEDKPAFRKASKTIKQIVSEAKKKAMKTRKVTITSNDKRDNDIMTTAYLGFENQYFGMDKLVPLDVTFECEQCLIDIAKTVTYTLHKDELIDGKRTGNKTPVQSRKFNVNFED